MRSFTTCVVFAILIMGVVSCAAPQPVAEQVKESAAAMSSKEEFVRILVEEPPPVAPAAQPTDAPGTKRAPVEEQITDVVNAFFQELQWLPESEERSHVQGALIALMQQTFALVECQNDLKGGATLEIANRAQQVVISIGKVRQAYLTRWFSFSRTAPLPRTLEAYDESLRALSDELFRKAETFAYEAVDQLCVRSVEDMIQKVTRALEVLRNHREEIPEATLMEIRRALEGVHNPRERLPEEINKLEKTSARLRELERLTDELERELQLR